jgi:ubiquinone/menaquinone biosynthesis C-methylase UbiE
MGAEYKIFEGLDLKEKSVLEVGCGTGQLSEFLAEKCKSFQGIDLSEEAISEAKNRTRKGKFLVADGQDLPFENAKFDLVVFSKSLHHLKQGLALKEAARVLKPSGEMIIIEPAIDTEFQKLLRPLQDEREALLGAARAITNSGLVVTSRDVIESPQKFVDFEDLCNELITSFAVTDVAGLKRHLQLTLGERVNEQPLVLSARLTCYHIKR